MSTSTSVVTTTTEFNELLKSLEYVPNDGIFGSTKQAIAEATNLVGGSVHILNIGRQALESLAVQALIDGVNAKEQAAHQLVLDRHLRAKELVALN